jgi:hypothetical protein
MGVFASTLSGSAASRSRAAGRRAREALRVISSADNELCGRAPKSRSGSESASLPSGWYIGSGGFIGYFVLIDAVGTVTGIPAPGVACEERVDGAWAGPRPDEDVRIL